MKKGIRHNLKFFHFLKHPSALLSHHLYVFVSSYRYTYMVLSHEFSTWIAQSRTYKIKLTSTICLQFVLYNAEMTRNKAISTRISQIKFLVNYLCILRSIGCVRTAEINEFNRKIKAKHCNWWNMMSHMYD